MDGGGSAGDERRVVVRVAQLGSETSTWLLLSD
jgi:hypothetical protein